MTDDELCIKVAHIIRIRRLEGEPTLGKVLDLFK